MFRYTIDTNILLDALIPIRPQHEEAKSLLKMHAQGKLECVVLASSLKDVYYLLTKAWRSEPKARLAIKNIRNQLAVIPLSLLLVDEALDSNEPDFEDGLIRVLAEIEDLDGIVSRDEEAFVLSRLARIEPKELVQYFHE